MPRETVSACFVYLTKATKRYSMPPVTVLGSGGDCVSGEGLPGTICGPNITNHKDGVGT